MISHDMSHISLALWPPGCVDIKVSAEGLFSSFLSVDSVSCVWLQIDLTASPVVEYNLGH